MKRKKSFKKIKISKEIILIITLFIFAFFVRLLLIKGISAAGDDRVAYCEAASIIRYQGFTGLLNRGTDYLWTFSIGWPLILGYILKILGLEFTGGDSVREAYPCIINSFFGSIAVVITYYFIKQFWKSPIPAIIGSILFIYNFSDMQLSTSALAWTSGFVFFILCIYASYKTVENPVWYNFLFFYLSLGIAILIRYPNYIIPAVIFLWILVFHRSRLKSLFLRWEHIAFSPIVFIMMIPQLLYNKVYHKGYFVTGYQYYEHFEQMNLLSQNFLFRIKSFFLFFCSFRFISPIIIFFVLYGLYILIKRRNFQKIGFLLIWFTTLSLVYIFTIPSWGLGNFPWFSGFVLLILGAGGIYYFSLQFSSKTWLFFLILILITSLIFIPHTFMSIYVNMFTTHDVVDKKNINLCEFFSPFANWSNPGFPIHFPTHIVPGIPNISSFYILSERLFPLFIFLLFIWLILQRFLKIYSLEKISISFVPIWIFSIFILFASFIFTLWLKGFSVKFAERRNLYQEEIKDFYQRARWKDCLKKIDEFISLFGEKDLLAIKGDCLYNLGDTEKAIEVWKKAAHFVPNIAYNLGVILFNKGRFKEAIESLYSLTSNIKMEKSSYYVMKTLRPDVIELGFKACFLEAESYLKLEDYKKAREYFKFVKDNAPSDELRKLSLERLKFFP